MDSKVKASAETGPEEASYLHARKGIALKMAILSC